MTYLSLALDRRREAVDIQTSVVAYNRDIPSLCQTFSESYHVSHYIYHFRRVNLSLKP